MAFEVIGSSALADLTYAETIGSLAIAEYAQATGVMKAATDNVVYVNFAKKMVTSYATANATTEAAVFSEIATGATISTGGVIILTAAAVALIVLIITYYLTSNPGVTIGQEKKIYSNNITKISSTDKGIFIFEEPKTTKEIESKYPSLRYFLSTTDITTIPFFEIETSKDIRKLFTINDYVSLWIMGHPYPGSPDGKNLKVSFVFNKTILERWDNSSEITGYQDVINLQQSGYGKYTVQGYNYPVKRFGIIRCDSYLKENIRNEATIAGNFSIIQEIYSIDEYGFQVDTNYKIDNYRTLLTDKQYNSIKEIAQTELAKSNPKPFAQYWIDALNEIVELQGDLYIKPVTPIEEIPEVKYGNVVKIDTGFSTATNPDPNLEELNKALNDALSESGFDYSPDLSIDAISPNVPIPVPDPIPDAPPPVIPSNTIGFPEIPEIGAVGSNMVKVYNPTSIELGKFNEYLFSTGIESISKFFANPSDYIIGLGIIPCEPLHTEVKYNVTIGNTNVPDCNSFLVTSEYVTVDMGSISINGIYNNFLDYSPYTKVSIFLPYIGEREISTDDIMNSTVNLVYKIDVLTGNCVALLKINKTIDNNNLDAVLYQWEGNVRSEVPLTGATANFFGALGVAGAGFKITKTAASAGLAPVAAAVAGATVVGSLATATMKPNIQRIGTLSGNHGILGVQKPYLIFNRPRRATPDIYNEFIGKSDSKIVNLKDVSGKVYVKEIHLNNIPCTDEEKKEIETLLREGVII